MRFGPGDTFPDLTAVDHAGRTRTLAELANGDPLVLLTYRGYWCPKEQAFFRRLVAFQEEVEVAYTSIASLSVDPPEIAAAYRAGLGARWTFLSDPDREHLDALGLRETTDTVHHPYLPAGFVLAPDLTVHSVYSGYWYWGRPGVEDLRRDLRDLSRAIRPDWDISR